MSTGINATTTLNNKLSILDNLIDGGVASVTSWVSGVSVESGGVSETAVVKTGGVSETSVVSDGVVGDGGDSSDGLVSSGGGSGNDGGDGDLVGVDNGAGNLVVSSGVILSGHWGLNSNGGGGDSGGGGVDDGGSTIVQASIAGLLDGVGEVSSETGGVHNGVSEGWVTNLTESIGELDHVSGGSDGQDSEKNNGGLHDA